MEHPDEGKKEKVGFAAPAMENLPSHAGQRVRQNVFAPTGKAGGGKR
jgi:hypothetical protein